MDFMTLDEFHKQKVKTFKKEFFRKLKEKEDEIQATPFDDVPIPPETKWPD